MEEGVHSQLFYQNSEISVGLVRGWHKNQRYNELADIGVEWRFGWC